MSVNQLIQNIRQELQNPDGTYNTRASQKDEQRVMREMLNDREYQVGIYDNSGQVGTYCPAECARNMVAGIISGTTKVSNAEASQLASGYEFGKAEAAQMTTIAKTFVNTYLETGRKLPLGGTESSDASLIMVNVPAGETTYPAKNADGTWGTKTNQVPAYGKVKATSPCPTYLK